MRTKSSTIDQDIDGESLLYDVIVKLLGSPMHRQIGSDDVGDFLEFLFHVLLDCLQLLLVPANQDQVVPSLGEDVAHFRTDPAGAAHDEH